MAAVEIVAVESGALVSFRKNIVVARGMWIVTLLLECIISTTGIVDVVDVEIVGEHAAGTRSAHHKRSTTLLGDIVLHQRIRCVSEFCRIAAGRLVLGPVKVAVLHS